MIFPHRLSSEEQWMITNPIKKKKIFFVYINSIKFKENTHKFNLFKLKKFVF